MLSSPHWQTASVVCKRVAALETHVRVFFSELEPYAKLYKLTLREVIPREALIYTMPTVAAGGGHILNIDFFCCPSDDEEDEEGEQGEKNIPKQGKASSVAEALADTQAELEAQSAIPSSGKESGKESADSAKPH